MNEQLKQQMRRDILRLLDGIKNDLDEDRPDFLLASRIVHLFWVSVGYLPEDMSREFTRLLSEGARRYVGLCADPKCNNHIPVYRSHPIYCDKCNAQTTADVFSLEMELQKDEPEEKE